MSVKFPAQTIFRGVWQAFVRRQPWDYFTCFVCATPTHPHECPQVVLDGVTVGPKLDKCPHLKNPKHVFTEETVSVKMGSFQRTRFAHSQKMQDDLLSLVVTQTGFYKRDRDIPKMAPQKARDFLDTLLTDPRYHHFAEFLEWGYSICNNEKIEPS